MNLEAGFPIFFYGVHTDKRGSDAEDGETGGNLSLANVLQILFWHTILTGRTFSNGGPELN